MYLEAFEFVLAVVLLNMKVPVDSSILKGDRTC